MKEEKIVEREKFALTKLNRYDIMKKKPHSFVIDQKKKYSINLM